MAIRLPQRSKEVEGCHLLFMFFHASSKDIKTQPFAFSFLPITDESGVMIMDSRYKVGGWVGGPLPCGPHDHVSGLLPTRGALLLRRPPPTHPSNQCPDVLAT